MVLSADYAAGLLGNAMFWREGTLEVLPSLPMASAPLATCGGGACGGGHEQQTVGLWAKLRQGVRSAITDIWGDLAGWFFIGIGIAACITVFVPDDLITRHLGGGIGFMLLMLVVGISMYICATASTPITAALILKGILAVSPVSPRFFAWRQTVVPTSHTTLESQQGSGWSKSQVRP